MWLLYVFLDFCYVFLLFCFFFFKQKTAYEIGVRLVGSEMCIRDSSHPTCARQAGHRSAPPRDTGTRRTIGRRYGGLYPQWWRPLHSPESVSYTHLTLPTIYSV